MKYVELIFCFVFVHVQLLIHAIKKEINNIYVYNFILLTLPIFNILSLVA